MESGEEGPVIVDNQSNHGAAATTSTPSLLDTTAADANTSNSNISGGNDGSGNSNTGSDLSGGNNGLKDSADSQITEKEKEKQGEGEGEGEGAGEGEGGEGKEAKGTTEKQVLNFKLTFGKKVHDITFDSNAPLKRLKEHIEGLTGVPTAMQKLMWKGMLKDDELPLSQTQLKDGAKVMLVGSTVSDVIQVNTIATTSSSSSSSSSSTEKPKPLCEQTEHKKIIDKGRSEDGIIGKRGTKSSITNGFSLHGMLNKMASKVRLTFKTDVEQLWIATNERTEKVSFNSIQQVISEPIAGQEDYHIMAFQLGPTEKSRYYVYFVPAQYVDSIKDNILGKFQYF